ncbi:hypothetical protein NA57DRAFT_52961 [Rhizodiscina lignyota]|uniref:Glycoside hydrolase family 125 protein n=1 Tax=Rhizodiscina lignyota TaxID=1504668 RepID=A0A9P4IQD4_9PEZI|nr:hypothetical protein NA57DRAFT_52961 [Rhizodiscina lignyota]
MARTKALLWALPPILGALAALLLEGASAQQDPLIDPLRYREACPDYLAYSKRGHPPRSEGDLHLPFQRPSPHCRTFTSSHVEKVIEDMSEKMLDKDLARIFENAFPNTLDTTVRWHVDGKERPKKAIHPDKGVWDGAQSFIVTGDINAEWLRDSTNQLAQYQILAKKDPAISNLILGAINTQVEFVIKFPYCNAFQPPAPSRLQPVGNGQTDAVHPNYEPGFVFECKYELDSLAHFLSLGNQYWAHTKNKAFLTSRWYKAIDTVLEVIAQQSKGTFEKNGKYVQNEYRFQRQTNTGTETLGLSGVGNPLANDTGLVRSAFRPSDDATILGFFIPANAFIAVELERTADMLKEIGGKATLAETLQDLSDRIREGIWEHGVVTHKKYGKVFAYEVDGYGGQILMDDANLPSLLALPLLGFLDNREETYQNTRKMILEKSGNPYYLQGREFHGIGGPHIGLEYAWPMSLLVQAMTSDDDDEIMDNLMLVRNASRLGLVHESINVKFLVDYTRPWFAWANSVFAQTIINIAQRKPHLLFGEGEQAYVFE